MLHGARKPGLVAAELFLYGPVIGRARKEQEYTHLETITNISGEN